MDVATQVRAGVGEYDGDEWACMQAHGVDGGDWPTQTKAASACGPSVDLHPGWLIIWAATHDNHQPISARQRGQLGRSSQSAIFASALSLSIYCYARPCCRRCEVYDCSAMVLELASPCSCENDWPSLDVAPCRLTVTEQLRLLSTQASLKHSSF